MSSVSPLVRPSLLHKSGIISARHAHVQPALRVKDHVVAAAIPNDPIPPPLIETSPLPPFLPSFLAPSLPPLSAPRAPGALAVPRGNHRGGVGGDGAAAGVICLFGGTWPHTCQNIISDSRDSGVALSIPTGKLI